MRIWFPSDSQRGRLCVILTAHPCERPPMEKDSTSADLLIAPERVEAPAKPVRVERRHSKRFCTELRVRLYWQDEQGRILDGSGIVRNACAGGFGVEFAERLEIDQLVTVRTTSSSLQCVVRHAQKGSKSFLLGLQVLPASDGRLESLKRLAVAVEASERGRSGE